MAVSENPVLGKVIINRCSIIIQEKTSLLHMLVWELLQRSEYACLAWFHLSVPLLKTVSVHQLKNLIRSKPTDPALVSLLHLVLFEFVMLEKHLWDLKEEACDLNGTFLWLFFCYLKPLATIIWKLPLQIQFNLTETTECDHLPTAHSSTESTDTF